MKQIIEPIIALLIACAVGFGLGKLMGMSLRHFLNVPSLERRVLYLEDKVSQLEDRMDRAALGLSNRVYQPSRILFHLGDDTNTVVLSNIFTNYYTQEQFDRLFHADDKRFDK